MLKDIRFGVFVFSFAGLLFVVMTQGAAEPSYSMLAAGSAADAMCNPYYDQCPCNQVPKMEGGQMKCESGKNTHGCPVGICVDTTNGQVTQGICVAANLCSGKTCDGEACKQAQPQKTDEKGGSPMPPQLPMPPMPPGGGKGGGSPMPPMPPPPPPPPDEQNKMDPNAFKVNDNTATQQPVDQQSQDQSQQNWVQNAIGDVQSGFKSAISDITGISDTSANNSDTGSQTDTSGQSDNFGDSTGFGNNSSGDTQNNGDTTIGGEISKMATDVTDNIVNFGREAAAAIAGGLNDFTGFFTAGNSGTVGGDVPASDGNTPAGEVPADNSNTINNSNTPTQGTAQDEAPPPTPPATNPPASATPPPPDQGIQSAPNSGSPNEPGLSHDELARAAENSIDMSTQVLDDNGKMIGYAQRDGSIVDEHGNVVGHVSNSAPPPSSQSAPPVTPQANPGPAPNIAPPPPPPVIQPSQSSNSGIGQVFSAVGSAFTSFFQGIGNFFNGFISGFSGR
jgi:hypothetical protein